MGNNTKRSWSFDHGSIQNRERSYVNSKPCEDAYLVDEARGIVIVADGVTRSALDQVYPDPSPAAEAARLVCRTAHQALVKGATLKEAAVAANDAVNVLNRSLYAATEIDYFTRDLACACAIFGVIRGSSIEFLFNGDCGLWVDRGAKGIERITRSQTAFLTEWRKGQPPEAATLQYQRRNIRNKPTHAAGFGAFSGEADAVALFEEGTLEISETIVLSTDGFEELFYSGAVLGDSTVAELAGAAEELEKKSGNRSDDKTAIVIRKRNRNRRPR